MIVRCPACESVAYGSDRYCACCGTEMPRHCRTCGAAVLHRIANYCTRCGAPFGADAVRSGLSPDAATGAM